MANDYTPISMIRGSSAIVDSTPIVDGQILFDETRKCLFMDNGSTREKYSGLGADSNIANVEDTTTASQPYTTGEFVVVEGQLYKVTASIARGDTFSVGTNIETDTVGSEITKINADLTAMSKRISKIGMKVLKYGTISATTTIQLGVTLDPSKYMVNINTSAYASGASHGTFVDYSGNTSGAGMYYKGYGWSSSYGQGAYLSAKTSTSCTITVSSGITASYEIIQIAE